MDATARPRHRMSAIDPFDDIDLDLDPPEPSDDDLRDEDGDGNEEWGCCYPDRCCMPGHHMLSECHTAEDLMALEADGRREDEERQPEATA